MGILMQKTKVVDITKPAEIRTYLTVSVLGKSLSLNINYKNINVPELDMNEKEIDIYLPLRYKKSGTVDMVSAAIQKMYDEIAEIEIANSMEKIRVMLGFAPEDYEVKIINGKIAKCEDSKITINPELMKYKRETIEYVVAHEFCHLKYKSHGKRFYQIIEKYIPDYKKYEKEISEYEY